MIILKCSICGKEITKYGKIEEEDTTIKWAICEECEALGRKSKEERWKGYRIINFTK